MLRDETTTMMGRLAWLGVEEPEAFVRAALEGQGWRICAALPNGVDGELSLPEVMTLAGQLSGARYEACLIPVTAERLEHVEAAQASLTERNRPALLAVVTDDSLRTAALAGRLDFDGLLVPPFSVEDVGEILAGARLRRQRREALVARYGKVRQLCRDVNRRRRELRGKVDLLCEDLVSSNRDLADTLHQLRRAYEFQNGLIGEFDLQCLLYKALQMISEDMAGAQGAIYLLEQAMFEAHLIDDDHAETMGMLEAEECLEGTVVAEVLAEETMVLRDGADDESLTALGDSGVLAAPLWNEKELLGVIALYGREKPFTTAEQQRLKTVLGALGRLIAADQKLRMIIG